ncbi:MAG: APC family permease [Kiritimatiellae bacterium]|jgi:amino acid transporter|nr:APC family permease [Kiritimatiellia bacterium]
MKHSKKESLSLWGAVSMGTGVMIGAGIFALTGQMAELAGSWFPLAFLLSAGVAGFSAYSYIKLAAAYPSAGGIAMFLKKAYGRSVMTGACALLMYTSMIINESLVARTFGSYTFRNFGDGGSPWMVPALGVGLLILAFVVNISGNKFIQSFSFWMSFVKIAGLLFLAGGGLYASGWNFEALSVAPRDTGPISFIGAVALGILAYKGFTTITNSGGELKNPHKNVGRAIIISLGICTVIYVLVALAVGANLSIAEIVQSKNTSLAEAARPAYGDLGMWITIGFAIAATVSGIIASVFAVSRMLAMLTEMEMVPHRHFGLPGDVQKHTLIYTIFFAMALTIFFDLSRIASLGAIFYIIMDMCIHWGVLRHLRKDVEAKAWILITALGLDAVILLAFIWVKTQSDPTVLWISLGGLVLVFAGEKFFLKLHGEAHEDPNYHVEE